MFLGKSLLNAIIEPLPDLSFMQVKLFVNPVEMK